jgi:uncharacterized protein (TIGR02284 family)
MTRSAFEAGALDFRDFSGSPGEKENRTDIARTLPLTSPKFNRNPRIFMATETTTHRLNHEEVEETLRSVIESLIDGQEGFLHIGEHLKDETLRRFFAGESLKRAEFRGDLEEMLHQEGVHDVKEHGTANGTAMRIWAGMKSKLGGGDHTLLETAEQCEDAAKTAYEEALAGELPLPIREILFKQSLHIENSHDFVKAACDSLK